MIRFLLGAWLALAIPPTASAQVLGGHRPATTAPRDYGFLTAFRTVIDIGHLNGADADTRFNWDADISADIDVVDVGPVRGNLFVNIETIIGNEFRGVDPNQNNYTADVSVFVRLPRGELSTTFHHVSRHLADRATGDAISWNMLGVGYGNRITLGRFELDAGVRAMWTVERAGVDYDAQVGGYARVTHSLGGRLALLGAADGVAVQVDPLELGRANQTGGRVEGGLRITAALAMVDLFIAREQRIDATSDRRDLARWTQFGVRVTTPIS